MNNPMLNLYLALHGGGKVEQDISSSKKFVESVEIKPSVPVTHPENKKGNLWEAIQDATKSLIK